MQVLFIFFKLRAMIQARGQIFTTTAELRLDLKCYELMIALARLTYNSEIGLPPVTVIILFVHNQLYK